MDNGSNNRPDHGSDRGPQRRTDDEIGAVLRDSLNRVADGVALSGDGLERIRERTGAGRGAFRRWLAPVIAAAAAVAAIIAVVVIPGMNDDRTDGVAQASGGSTAETFAGTTQPATPSPDPSVSPDPTSTSTSDPTSAPSSTGPAFLGTALPISDEPRLVYPTATTAQMASFLAAGQDDPALWKDPEQVAQSWLTTIFGYGALTPPDVKVESVTAEFDGVLVTFSSAAAAPLTRVYLRAVQAGTQWGYAVVGASMPGDDTTSSLTVDPIADAQGVPQAAGRARPPMIAPGNTLTVYSIAESTKSTSGDPTTVPLDTTLVDDRWTVGIPDAQSGVVAIATTKDGVVIGIVATAIIAPE